MTATEAIADFALALRFASLPDDVVRRTELALLDVVGCALAAAAEEEEPSPAGGAWEAPGGPSELWASGAGAPPADAALANGMLAHALDYDDTHAVSMTHVSAVVAPAAVAVAQACGADGRDLVAALVAGAETTTRVGLACPGAFHARGLHPTSVCGVFGATVAAGKLLALTRVQMVAALGIAGSTASGLLEFLADGSATKPFHAGWAAHAAVTSAVLAREGLTGPASVLEGRYGIFRALLQTDADAALRDQLGDLGQRWESLAIATKSYPACHVTHAGMDGALRLRQGGLRAEEVASIQLEVPAVAVGLVLEPAARKERPATPYEAKFSLPFCVAAMLVDGSVGVRTYSTERLSDPRILDVACRAEHRVMPVEDRGPFFTLLRVGRTDGATVEVDVAHPTGTPENPMTAEAVRAKFADNAHRRLGARVDEVAEAILGIDTRTTVAPLSGAAAAAGA